MLSALSHAAIMAACYFVVMLVVMRLVVMGLRGIGRGLVCAADLIDGLARRRTWDNQA